MTTMPPVTPVLVNHYDYCRKIRSLTNINGTLKSLLWDLVDRHGRDGKMFPGFKTLARDNALSLKTVYRLLKKAVDECLLKIDSYRKSKRRYLTLLSPFEGEDQGKAVYLTFEIDSHIREKKISDVGKESEGHHYIETEKKEREIKQQKENVVESPTHPFKPISGLGDQGYKKLSTLEPRYAHALVRYTLAQAPKNPAGYILTLINREAKLPDSAYRQVDLPVGLAEYLMGEESFSEKEVRDMTDVYEVILDRGPVEKNQAVLDFLESKQEKCSKTEGEALLFLLCQGWSDGKVSKFLRRYQGYLEENYGRQ